jgi:hypothetical protein
MRSIGRVAGVYEGLRQRPQTRSFPLKEVFLHRLKMFGCFEKLWLPGAMAGGFAKGFGNDLF